ncbi:MAG: hypothetical protein OQK55_08995 [Thermoanaerobaculales bacterium]|nr:hypothetical protein [Thermoanaerobaculales bacterium]
MAELTERVSSLNIADPNYDFVLVSFVDKPADYFKKIQNTDRICQMEIGYDESVWKLGTKISRMTRYVAERLIHVVGRSDLSEECRQAIHGAILDWAEQIEGGLNRGED